jgi:histidyl-tRNA synthetase
MEALGLFTAEATSQTRALIIHFGPEYLAHTLPLSASLRQAGIATELFPEPAKLKKQFAYADKKGIPYTLIVGETEAVAGMCQIKNMTTGTQVTLPLTAVADWFLQQHV